MRAPVAQARGLIRATEAQQSEIATFQRRTLDALERLEDQERDRLRCAPATSGQPLPLAALCSVGPVGVTARLLCRSRRGRRECQFGWIGARDLVRA
jgi:hypothetical protein